jgi:hypothetical protein
VVHIYSAIKAEIVSQASAMMRREVHVGDISGNLVNSVTLKDIRIAKHKKLSEGEAIKIKEAKVFIMSSKPPSSKAQVHCPKLLTSRKSEI